tara:strand:- start:323 stop:1489 length:1167 start_codon:yes stop_codon:yes gene_type:complete
MAKKLLNRLGIKTRKQKIEAEKKRQQRLEAQEAANANRKWQETSTGDEKFLAGRTNVGDFKSLKAKTGVKDSKYGTQKYKSGDEFYDTKDTSDSMSKMEQRVANRQLAKEGRKNRRAEKVAVRKGMSNQQAKDFMQNRRDRFKQMGTNFVKGLAGLPMDTKVDKRLMRKGGSGTLQNTIGEDGKVYDATAPYKGSAAKGFSDRGGSRNEVDEYMDTLQPKRNEPVPIKPVIVPDEKIEENNNKVDENEGEPEVIEEQVDENPVKPNNYSNLLINRNVAVDTSGLPNRSFLTHNESSQGKYNNPKNILNNLVDPSKVDKNGLQTAMDEIILNKALSGSGNVSFNDNFAGKYGNVGGMNKSNYDINLLNTGKNFVKTLPNRIKNTLNKKK